MIEELSNKFPLSETQIIGEQNQKDFIALFGAILRMRNLLLSFDEFKGKELQRDHDLDTIIAEEKLKPEDTRKFMENAFRDGEIKTAGTDIDKLMPPISRFGDGGV